MTEISNMAAYLNRHLCVAGVRKKGRLLTVATELLAKNFVLCVLCQNLVFGVPEFLSCQDCKEPAVPHYRSLQYPMIGTCSTT